MYNEVFNLKGSALPADPKNMNFEKIQKMTKVFLQKIFDFEGFRSNGVKKQILCKNSV